MSKLIIVAHPTTGLLFTPTANADWVKCQLKQEGIKVTNGVISKANRVAFPLISKEVADTLVASGLKSGMEFPVEGKIQHQRSRTPFYENQAVVVNPKTAEPILFEGEQYYQQYEFITDMTQPDEVNDFVHTTVKVAAF